MTLLVVASEEAWSPSAPRVVVTVSADTAGAQPVRSGAGMAVYRRITAEDGSTVDEPIISAAGLRASASRSVPDYHPPLNVEVSYFAIADGQISAASEPVVLYSTQAWLVHPENPKLSLMINDPYESVHVNEVSEFKRAARVGTFQVFGASRPVTRSEGVRSSAEFTVTFSVPWEQADAVWALLADSGPVLLNTPGDMQRWDVARQWVQPGDITMRNLGRVNEFPRRQFTMPCVAVDQPAVELVPERTWGDAKAEGLTWAQARAKYATWGDAQEGIPRPV